MSKFAVKSHDPKKTTNYEGGEAYQLSDEMKLYTLACTSLVENQFYRPAADVLSRTSDLVIRCDPDFVSNLASYSRNEMNMRSFPLVLIGFMALHYGGRITRRTVSRVVKRVDEITELLAFFAQINPNATESKPLTKVRRCLLRGLADVFESGRFGEYNYAKYNKKTDVKLKDVIRLTHPKPKDEEQKNLFKRILDGTMATPETWETALSKAGQDGTPKKEVWTKLIAENRLGYMALLRNLRNILKAGVSGVTLDAVVAKLCNKKEVANSKQFPFRFWSAYKELDTLEDCDLFDRNRVKQAIDAAIVHAARNWPKFGDRTVVAVDTSGSMTWSSVSKMSSITCSELAMVFGAIMSTLNVQCLVYQFGEKMAELPKATLGVHNTVAQWFGFRDRVGHATNGYLILEYLLQNEIVVDNIFMLTDTQLYGGSLRTSWELYYQRINAKAKLWIFDLTGYGTTPVRLTADNVVLVSGFSDKVFDTVERIKSGESVLETIKAYGG